MRYYRYIATLLSLPCLMLADTSYANDKVKYCVETVLPLIGYWQNQVDDQKQYIEDMGYDIDKASIENALETSIIYCGNDTECIDRVTLAHDVALESLNENFEAMNGLL